MSMQLTVVEYTLQGSSALSILNKRYILIA